MREACSCATCSGARHARFVHVDRLVPAHRRLDLRKKEDSSDAAQPDDGQVLASRAVLDREFKPRTTTSIDLRVRSSAGRAARPSTSWLEARREARGRSFEVDLVRGAHMESGVRPVFVVQPHDETPIVPRLSFRTGGIPGTEGQPRSCARGRRDLRPFSM